MIFWLKECVHNRQTDITRYCHNVFDHTLNFTQFVLCTLYGCRHSPNDHPPLHLNDSAGIPPWTVDTIKSPRVSWDYTEGGTVSWIIVLPVVTRATLSYGAVSNHSTDPCSVDLTRYEPRCWFCRAELGWGVAPCAAIPTLAAPYFGYWHVNYSHILWTVCKGTKSSYCFPVVSRSIIKHVICFVFSSDLVWISVETYSRLLCGSSFI